MRLHEYQAKQLFKKYNLPIPLGYVCHTLDEVENAACKIGFNGPWIVKCQVHAGGRGKAGGLKFADSKEEIKNFAKQWLGRRLITYQTQANGQPVNQLLVEAFTNIAKELYLGAVIDRSFQRLVFMASNNGGMEIEKIAKEKTHLIYKAVIDPLVGPMPYQGRDLAFKLGLEGKLVKQFTEIFMGLAKIFLEFDLTLIEINPLVITSQGDLMCLDSKLDIDDNALFRHLDLQEMRDFSQENPLEARAAQWKLNYVALNGNIGFIVNGAGLALSTMDIVQLHGGTVANFLDIGGSITPACVTEAIKIILSENNVKAILVNIFGGIVRCDLIADGMINAAKEVSIDVPIIVRMEGNNSTLGLKKLSNSSLHIIKANSLNDAAHKAVVSVQ